MNKINIAILESYSAIKDLLVLVIGGYSINITLAPWNRFSIWILLLSFLLSFGLILILRISKKYIVTFKQENTSIDKTIEQKENDALSYVFNLNSKKKPNYFIYLISLFIVAGTTVGLYLLTSAYQNENNINQTKVSNSEIVKMEESFKIILNENNRKIVEYEKTINESKKIIIDQNKKIDSLKSAIAKNK
jgi:hypothetical protein